jgi:D-amino peptidase
MKTAVLALVIAMSASAQPKTVFVITDAEGVAGVCRQEQTDPKDSEMRQLLTAEINSAVAGFLDGGATDVYVWDGHDGSATVSALTIDPRAHLIMGGLPSTMLMERHYSAWLSSASTPAQIPEAALWPTATAHSAFRTC